MDAIVRQCAVIPYRLEPSLNVLLITSRETHRWIIPKGNVPATRTPRDAAAHEAYEEAGIRGILDGTPIGFYTYEKVLKDGSRQPTMVEVFPLKVTKETKSWPEKKERQARWVTPQEAAQLVLEPSLASLLLQLPEYLMRASARPKDAFGTRLRDHRS